MKPTDVLKREHRIIEQVLDCLEQMIQSAQASQPFDRQDASAALEFLRVFADEGHHVKEEELLFPAMAARGVPDRFGPIGVMISEHELGRTLLRAMSAALDSDNDPSFALSGSRFVELLRDHIAKEDNLLFAMADAVLGDDQTKLSEAFSRAATEFGAERIQEAIDVADRLAARYGVALAAQRSPRPFLGCAHQA